MIDLHILKLRARHPVSAEEEQAVRNVVSHVETVPAARTLVRAGQPLEHSTLLLDGLLCRYKDLKSGARQITELHIAGDFADLHGFTLKSLDHNLGTLTDCTIASVPHQALAEITERFPHLARLYWFSTNLDAAIHREWEVSLGRRTALSRLAHLFCELYIRLGIVKLTQTNGYPLPLTQTDLAECLGLTPVHVNRTLRQLRETGLVEFRDRQVIIRDLPGLRRVAEFDDRYLYLAKRDI